MSYRHLTDHDRYVIYHLNLYGLSQAEIGRRLGRCRSTISRELRRNCNVLGQYFPEHADHLRRRRRRAAAPRPRTGDPVLMAHVEARLQARWSPGSGGGFTSEVQHGGKKRDIPAYSPSGERHSRRSASTRTSHRRLPRWVTGRGAPATTTLASLGMPLFHTPIPGPATELR